MCNLLAAHVLLLPTPAAREQTSIKPAPRLLRTHGAVGANSINIELTSLFHLRAVTGFAIFHHKNVSLPPRA